MTASEETLRRISQFHGHLGPFVVVGYRMGEAANVVLGADPFGKTACVLTGGKPPRSCVVDGIQLSSGCTLGKGTIAVVDEDEVAAIFKSKKDGRSLRLSLKAAILKRIEATDHQLMEDLAAEIYSLGDSEMFDARLEE